MIDGEIYALDYNNKCVFAYCERGSCKTSFYIGCTTMGNVIVSTSSCIRGMSSNSPSHLADETERERFNSLLARKGCRWNKLNKVIIKDDGEVIKI